MMSVEGEEAKNVRSLKVTRSHLHSKSGSTSEMVQDGVVVTTHH